MHIVGETCIKEHQLELFWQLHTLKVFLGHALLFNRHFSSLYLQNKKQKMIHVRLNPGTKCIQRHGSLHARNEVSVDENSSVLYILHVQYNKFHVTETDRDLYSMNPHSWWWRNMRLSYGWKYRANRMTTILAHWHKGCQIVLNPPQSCCQVVHILSRSVPNLHLFL